MHTVIKLSPIYLKPIWQHKRQCYVIWMFYLWRYLIFLGHCLLLSHLCEDWTRKYCASDRIWSWLVISLTFWTCFYYYFSKYFNLFCYLWRIFCQSWLILYKLYNYEVVTILALILWIIYLYFILLFCMFAMNRKLSKNIITISRNFIIMKN